MASTNKAPKFKIICSNCSNFAESSISEENLINITRMLGWHEIDGKHYCPECIEYNSKKKTYKLINCKKNGCR